VTTIIMASLTWQGLTAPEVHQGSGNPLGALPDPMKLEWPVILFVIVLITLMYIFLKHAFFKPVTRVMDEREAAILAGSATKAQAAARIEQRQAEYAAKLKELRTKAFEHRKTLATAAAQEKQAILDEAREKAGEQRRAAVEDLKAQQEDAKTQLMAQIDALSESMAQHLLKQA
jgi:F-type H+-transporting ATPase subunit b